MARKEYHRKTTVKEHNFTFIQRANNQCAQFYLNWGDIDALRSIKANFSIYKSNRHIKLPQKYQSSFQQLYIDYIEKHYIFTIYLQYCLLITRGDCSRDWIVKSLQQTDTHSTIHETHFLINQHKTHLCNSILALCIAMT